MSNAFAFTASCPRCGGELLTEGFAATIEAPDLVHHDARCDVCLDVYRITVCAAIVEPWPVDRHNRRQAAIEAAAYASQVLEAERIG